MHRPAARLTSTNGRALSTPVPPLACFFPVIYRRRPRREPTLAPFRQPSRRANADGACAAAEDLAQKIGEVPARGDLGRDGSAVDRERDRFGGHCRRASARARRAATRCTALPYESSAKP